MNPYSPQTFSHLLGTPGFSDSLLKDHFTLYEGYVTNTNTLLETLEGLRADGKGKSPECAELRRRFSWEWNGMRLHELYFGNLTKSPKPLAKGGALEGRLAASFGSFEAWSEDFQATGAMRGIGWAALFWDPAGERLLNGWINEHDRGELAGCPVVLLMDVFEHAFLRDYGVKKDAYIDAFLAAADWSAAEARLEEALRGAPELAGTP